MEAIAAGADRTPTAGLAYSARVATVGESLDASAVFACAGVVVAAGAVIAAVVTFAETVATDRSSGTAFDDRFVIELLNAATFAIGLLKAVVLAIEPSMLCSVAIGLAIVGALGTGLLIAVAFAI
jgi:hypothetical protein